MEYYSAIKKNTFEPVLMRWMKLEPIIQSEVSQKEKHQYSILTHIYGIYKDGNNDPLCETAEETQMYQIRSDQISRSVVSDSLQPYESQQARPPCPSPTPGVHSDSHPSSQ